MNTIFFGVHLVYYKYKSMRSLYAYFGLIDLHNINTPGHSLYQLGLIDSILDAFEYEKVKFDFYSYYPSNIITDNIGSICSFPKSQIGDIFNKYKKKLFDVSDSPILSKSLNDVITKIKNKEYQNLYLKARFRNLSTLRKKWKDALSFETIIDTAISVGYHPKNIYILDTDLSLPDSFYKKYLNLITIAIPSINFPAISTSFLDDCVNSNLNSKIIKKPNSVFYGNINTSNYKSGNSKSAILIDVLQSLNSFYKNKEADFILISKQYENIFDSAIHVPREKRLSIWNTLSNSSIMINVTKEKYNSKKFIPARIYEAMIFGLIPVSYTFNFLSEMFSFSDIEDLLEIIYYLSDCDSTDIKKAYEVFINNYISYCNNQKFH